MTRSDILAIAGVAAVTMVVTCGLLMPRHVTAESENLAIKPMIAVPKLTVDGCAFTVSTDKPEYAPGEKLALNVKVTNTGLEPAATSVWLSVTATSPASRFSRVMVLPKPLWTGQCPVELQPGQSQTFTIQTGAALPEGQTVSISMSAKGQAVMADIINLQAEVGSR